LFAIVKAFGKLFLSLCVYLFAFGWKFAGVMVLMLVAHEAEHWIAMKQFRVKPKLQTFIPIVGTYLAMSQMADGELVDAWVAYAGALLGGLVALAICIFGSCTGTLWLMAGGAFGCMLNLLQLIPGWIFDGKFIVRALSRRYLIPIILILIALAFSWQSLFLLLISVALTFSLIKPFKLPNLNFGARIPISGDTLARIAGYVFDPKGKFRQKLTKEESLLSKEDNVSPANEVKSPEDRSNVTESKSKSKSKIVVRGEKAVALQRCMISIAYLGLVAILAATYSIENSQIARKMPQLVQAKIQDNFPLMSLLMGDELPQAVPGGKTAGEYYKLSFQYKSAGWTEQARECVIKAMAMEPDGAIGIAAKNFLKTRLPINRVPEKAVLMNIQANAENAYFTRDRAEEIWKQCIAECPNFEWPYSNLADLLIQEGKLKEAEILLNRALKINPNYVNAWTRLAECKLKQNDKLTAQTSLEEALRLDPDDFGAKLIVFKIRFYRLFHSP
jgi:Zn-dependent protease